MTRDDHPDDLGLRWDEWGVLRWLDDRDQDVPMTKEELYTQTQRYKTLKRILDRLEHLGLLSIERARTGFGEGAAYLYRTLESPQKHTG